MIPPEPAADAPNLVIPKPRFSLTRRLRAYFLAGILVTAPTAITLYFTWAFVTYIDGLVRPIIPDRYNPEKYLPFSLPGIGLLIAFICITFIGAIAAGYFGRTIIRLTESVLSRMPVVRGFYGAVKQIFETVFQNRSNSFRQVVLLEYPRRGIWIIGFVTGMTEGEIRDLTEDDVVNVFIPSTPVPTTGFLIFVPRRDLIALSMTVEEGIKFVVSTGIVVPPDRRRLEPQNAVTEG
jgi:uncharacterized membrane protein